eukprot:gb/GECG01011292.1/.p1 GENE.gb/GECG01011292.1/~~gb/GECG01011292.1/.p1  ORF type:complete len:261 (+),score=9.04 gb/GECG01011292.1/:1-783(+)
MCANCLSSAYQGNVHARTVGGTKTMCIWRQAAIWVSLFVSGLFVRSLITFSRKTELRDVVDSNRNSSPRVTNLLNEDAKSTTYPQMFIEGKPRPDNIHDWLTINLFTNCLSSGSSTVMARLTLSSFVDGFGLEKVHVRVYVHPSRSTRDCSEYLTRLSTLGEVIRTHGLADGYRKSLVNTHSKYALQLEHDWMLRRRSVNHSISDLIQGMEELNIEYLGFTAGTGNRKRCSIPSKGPHITVCIAGNDVGAQQLDGPTDLT